VLYGGHQSPKPGTVEEGSDLEDMIVDLGTEKSE